VVESTVDSHALHMQGIVWLMQRGKICWANNCLICGVTEYIGIGRVSIIDFDILISDTSPTQNMDSDILHIAVWYSVLQCVAVCCSVLQCVAVCGSVWQGVAVCGSVRQCIAVCCSAWQSSHQNMDSDMLLMQLTKTSSANYSSISHSI